MKFDPSKVVDQNDLIPEGEYRTLVTKAEIGNNSLGSGELFKVTLDVVEGPFTRRKIFVKMDLSSSFGPVMLKRFIKALGVTGEFDTQDLPSMVRNKELYTVVKHSKDGVYANANSFSSGPTAKAKAQEPSLETPF